MTRTLRRVLSLTALVSALVVAGPVGAWAATPAPRAPSTSTQGAGKGLPEAAWLGGLGGFAAIIIICGLLVLRSLRVDRDRRLG